jgi:hypothetical protein
MILPNGSIICFRVLSTCPRAQYLSPCSSRAMEPPASVEAVHMLRSKDPLPSERRQTSLSLRPKSLGTSIGHLLIIRSNTALPQDLPADDTQHHRANPRHALVGACSRPPNVCGFWRSLTAHQSMITRPHELSTHSKTSAKGKHNRMTYTRGDRLLHKWVVAERPSLALQLMILCRLE